MGPPPGAARIAGVQLCGSHSVILPGRGVNTFNPIRVTDARSLAAPAIDVHVDAGTEVVREGAVIGTFFVIRAGNAELRQGLQRVRSLGPGDCFGEIDPHGWRPQRYGVVASSPLRLLAFSAFGIDRLCEAIPALTAQLARALPGS